MTKRRTGWEMVLDMMARALAELDRVDADDPHANRARDILTDALYLAKLNEASTK